MVDGFQPYPSEHRQGQHYSIKYLKSLLALGHVREVGPTGFALLSLIAAYEDRFMYSRAIGFREKQLADELGITRQTLRTVRAKLVKLGLLAFKPGARNRDGRYYTLGPWLDTVQNLDTIDTRDTVKNLGSIQPLSNHYPTTTRPTRPSRPKTKKAVTANAAFWGEDSSKAALGNALQKMHSIPEELNTDAFKAAWVEWLTHLKEKKCKVTPSAIRKQLKKLAAMGEAEAIAAIDHSIASGYQGIYPAPSNARKPRPAAADETYQELTFIELTGGRNARN
jgi:hypothetical protein